MNRVLARSSLVLLLAALPAFAQQSRYDQPGVLGERQTDTRDAVMQMRQDARWQLGFLDIEPQIAISNLGYVSNVFNEATGEARSDLKATGLAGLRGFFNLGPKVVISPFASLSYAWWQDLEELRSSNESFGVQLIGDFNRLQVVAEAGEVSSQRNLSSELELPVDVSNRRIDVAVEVDFWGPFQLTAGVNSSERRHRGDAAEESVSGLDLGTLDAEIELLDAGLTYEFPNEVLLTLGLQSADTTYLVDLDGRSSSGTGPMARLYFDGARLFVDLEAAWRDLDFVAPDSRPRRELSGRGLVEWRLTDNLGAGVWAASQLQASALASDAIFESQRTGAFVQRRVRQGSLRLFYETGQDDYASILLEDPPRADDLETLGISFNLELTTRMSLDIGLLENRRDSTDPGFDREFTSLRGVIRVGGNLLPW